MTKGLIEDIERKQTTLAERRRNLTRTVSVVCTSRICLPRIYLTDFGVTTLRKRVYTSGRIEGLNQRRWPYGRMIYKC